MNHAIENAEAWMDSIHGYCVAMDSDAWDRREELRDDPGRSIEEDTELAELDKYLSDFEDADRAREQAEESALSVELSGTWTPGSTPEADGYEILLSTGGPALRIVGKLGGFSEPASASLEYQDWGTPWTELCSADENDLLAFASVFYFGE